MLRSFHISSSNNQPGQLNVAECDDNTVVKLSISNPGAEPTAEIVLDYDAFNELCGLRYCVDLVEAEETEEVNSGSELTLYRVA